jgi:hypothetical protein
MVGERIRSGKDQMRPGEDGPARLSLEAAKGTGVTKNMQVGDDVEGRQPVRGGAAGSAASSLDRRDPAEWWLGMPSERGDFSKRAF